MHLSIWDPSHLGSQFETLSFIWDLKSIFSLSLSMAELCIQWRTITRTKGGLSPPSPPNFFFVPGNIYIHTLALYLCDAQLNQNSYVNSFYLIIYLKSYTPRLHQMASPNLSPKKKKMASPYCRNYIFI